MKTLIIALFFLCSIFSFGMEKSQNTKKTKFLKVKSFFSKTFHLKRKKTYNTFFEVADHIKLITYALAEKRTLKTDDQRTQLVKDIYNFSQTNKFIYKNIHSLLEDEQFNLFLFKTLNKSEDYYHYKSFAFIGSNFSLNYLKEKMTSAFTLIECKTLLGAEFIWHDGTQEMESLNQVLQKFPKKTRVHFLKLAEENEWDANLINVRVLSYANRLDDYSCLVM